jgi:catabolite regulation protein CreA
VGVTCYVLARQDQRGIKGLGLAEDKAEASCQYRQVGADLVS